MIDRKARDKVAEAIRRTRAGQVPRERDDPGMMAWNLEVKGLLLQGRRDPGVAAVVGKTSLFLPQVAHPNEDVYRLGSRCLVFLASNLEYPWPRPDFYNGLAMGMGCATVLVVLGSFVASASPLVWIPYAGLALGWVFWGVHKRRFQRDLATAGDEGAWPFLSVTDYQAALRAQEDSERP
ncbi:MAG TPA: hypothetical protein VGM19_05415 [Armatimonadota bacterium]|jgi:hypothetical protein